MDDRHPAIPPFTEDGLLPSGDYEVSLAELRRSGLVHGPDGAATWDAAWRGRLVDNLEILVRQLWRVGVREIFIDGSFVEDKDHPNDIDGYFECDLMRLATGELERDLNLLEPDKVWTWDPESRTHCLGFPKRQIPMWHKYRVELYPHVPGLGKPSGVRDRHGHEMEFPSAFRQTRCDGAPKGIVKIRFEGEAS